MDNSQRFMTHVSGISLESKSEWIFFILKSAADNHDVNV